MELPVDFSAYTRQLLGESAFEELVESMASMPSVSIRVNPAKWHQPFPQKWESVPWSAVGYYLPVRPHFTLDPLFHAGAYYVQEASSMFVEQVLRTFVTRQCAMLDLCAAPGGKSTLARSVLPAGSLLVSNEIVRTRAQVLAENIIKWGHPSTIVTCNAPADFTVLEGGFDVILADVPCSGEGMFRKDEGAVAEWSSANVDACWRRQRSIVADVWPCLKSGGIFIYSTCTYNTLENEENVRWIVQEYGAEVLEVPVSAGWGIQGNLLGKEFPVYRFFPSCVHGEGFFLAVLRKPAGDAVGKELAFETAGLERDENKKGKKNSRHTRKGKVTVPVIPEECRQWLADAEKYVWEVNEDALQAFPFEWVGMLNQLKEHLYLLHAGIEVATLKGRDWIPAHPLAMSTELCQGAFPTVEVSCDEALAYLRRESVVLDSSLPRGHVLLTHRGIPVGFVKHLGNRANNLYPNEWRIRSSYGKGTVIVDV